MRSDTFHALTHDLRVLGGGRVWSLMISLFGDLAQGQGDRIEGPVLSAIMSALDVKPEAARVALHRLRKDGWVQSQKRGRISQHSLTRKGRDESAAASPRIYAAPDAGPQQWQLVVMPPTGNLDGAGFIQVLPRVYVGAKGQNTPRAAVVLTGDTAPDWLQNQIIPPSLAKGYAHLHQSLASLCAGLPDGTALRPLDTAVLRCLVVHNWRRLVLKHPALPRALIPADSPQCRCHHLVADLLTRFARPTLADMGSDQTG